MLFNNNDLNSHIATKDEVIAGVTSIAQAQHSRKGLRYPRDMTAIAHGFAKVRLCIVPMKLFHVNMISPLTCPPGSHQCGFRAGQLCALLPNLGPLGSRVLRLVRDRGIGGLTSIIGGIFPLMLCGRS